MLRCFSALPAALAEALALAHLQPYSRAVSSSSGADPCAGPPTALQPSGEQQQRRRPLRS
ncbi:hypothetical protein B484DRAFT_425914, partial [Ochromonadaceae sp. CCMP2298]